MHNLPNDHFQQEFETADGEFELDPEFEFDGEFDGEFDQEFELDQNYETDGVQFEVYEMELAEELLELETDAEFLDWAKKVARRTAGVAANLITSPTGRQAVRALGSIAKRTLPVLGGQAGRAIGSAIGGRAFGRTGAKIGGAWGKRAGSFVGGKAGQAISKNLPGFVRLTADTLRNLSKAQQTGKRLEIRPAIARAASRHYPIILNVKGTLQARQMGGYPFKREFEFENEFEGEFEYDQEFEFDQEFEGDFELDGEVDGETGMTEALEMELAGELLNVTNDQELDMFLGSLVRKVGRGIKSFAKSSTGKALGGLLKKVAKKALPIAGGALGNLIAPGVGGALGSKLGSLAGNLFELELEGLSPEDQEFELARAYVRFAGNAVRNASRMSPYGGYASARNAFKHAARNYAPGLMRRRRSWGGYPGSRAASSGRWYRSGGNIILQGIQ